MTSIPHAQIVSRVLRRPALRKDLIADPRATLARSFGVELPPDVKVLVVEDTMTDVHIVVPGEPGLRGPEEGVIAETLTRFRSDATFRKSVEDDPKAVIQAETGATLPANLRLRVVVETPTRRVIQLPPENASQALTSAKVEAMYGGGGGGDGDYYVLASSDTFGGCSNIDTVDWSCCESEVNKNTVLLGGDCCGVIEGPDPGHPGPGI